MKIIKTKNKNPKKERVEALFNSEDISSLFKDEVPEVKIIASFSECENDSEIKAIKRRLGLPITKTPRYMRGEGLGWTEDDVLAYEIVAEYPSFCELEVQTAGFGKIKIHHAYFAHMQKPSFIRDMEEGKE